LEAFSASFFLRLASASSFFFFSSSRFAFSAFLAAQLERRRVAGTRV
jgi:hypothetical protein